MPYSGFCKINNKYKKDFYSDYYLLSIIIKKIKLFLKNFET